jgi:GNAT superfamily N-acetyltransferase
VVVIRTPRPGDVDAIAALLAELGYPTSPEAVQARLTELGKQTHVVVFVADAGQGAAGLATAYIVPVVHADRPVAVLSALVVHEGQRRRGVGRQLVEAAQAWARDRQAYRITVSSGLARQGAHSFYERLGYEHTSRRYSRLL